MNTFLIDPAARELLAAAAAPARTRLDGADGDAVASDAQAFELRRLSMAAASTVQAWAETADLEDGEGATDRLLAMLVGIADDNKDGELSDDEAAIIDVAANEAYSYLAAKGVSEADLTAMFEAEDPAESNAAGARVLEFLASALPNAEAADEEVDDFTFGAEAQEGVFDSAGHLLTDAVYKKRFAVRGGKKVMVRKRISGTVRLSAAQKVAIRKARMKSNSSMARMRRLKSMRVRKARGLK